LIVHPLDEGQVQTALDLIAKNPLLYGLDISIRGSAFTDDIVRKVMVTCGGKKDLKKLYLDLRNILKVYNLKVNVECLMD